MNPGDLRWGDAVIGILASALVIAAFVLAYFPAGEARVLVISQAGASPQHEPLDRHRVLEVNGPAGTTRIEIEPGRARCAESPGQRNICEASGWLQAHGDMAVSLPNRLTLQVLGSEPGFDSLHY
ncbi:NusG domain II-containing protein [Thioalkalivibrio sp. ALJT]|uniref:NusG domain II-containing protein n=1 Tax=Thioalkalivibrio sp. ALJT TaxID=1158146 RepID=UPI00037D276D|nr:NusG domain II-containing protein [Thioalkalivibrio sp. ALJT]